MLGIGLDYSLMSYRDPVMADKVAHGGGNVPIVFAQNGFATGDYIAVGESPLDSITSSPLMLALGGLALWYFVFRK
jgi:hypothetical protein